MGSIPTSPTQPARRRQRRCLPQAMLRLLGLVLTASLRGALALVPRLRKWMAVPSQQTVRVVTGYRPTSPTQPAQQQRPRF